ncbi:hypothetical protein ELI_1983 [Eubacterium callanderi]|uniref:Uncharacterized protein n=1 Tax=Eubacterium callanderi TaxID=53442 RepID=E3GDN6_9FIRM|nr:hypothetical protein ELI_1983 [Eubacterium callanderi]
MPSGREKAQKDRFLDKIISFQSKKVSEMGLFCVLEAFLGAE